MLKLERSIQSYYSEKLAVANPRTEKTSRSALANFTRFTREFYDKSLDEMTVEFKDEQVAYDVLQAWINHNNKQVSSRTVKQYFNIIKSFLHYKGIKFHQMDIKENLRFPKILEDEKHGVTRIEIKKLFEYLKHKKRAMYLCQISSGMRIGELMRLRVNHLSLEGKRIIVSIPAEHNKNGRARTTFFSKEAEKHLRPILRKLDDNDLIFTKNENWEHARNAEMDNMQRWTEKAGLKNITTHSFRAYFITKISRIDPNLAKRLAGQKSYLDQYDRLSLEEKLEKYLELEPSLLIFEAKPESEEIMDLKKEMAKYKESYDEFTKLSTDEEYKQRQLGPLVDKITKRMKDELRAEILEEMRKK